MKKTIKKAVNQIGLFFHRLFNRNKNMTIIARDCIGGVVYNQYGMKFLSPTINLYFLPDDFNLFCLNLKQYIDGDLMIDEDNLNDFPVGILKPTTKSLKEIKVYFMHYNSFDEAQKKWDERKKRIHWDNIYVISNITNSEDASLCTQEFITEFNKIAYKKVIFVDRKYGLDGEYILDKPKNSGHAWALCPNSKVFAWKKVINQFNFNKFFNR